MTSFLGNIGHHRYAKCLIGLQRLTQDRVTHYATVNNNNNGPNGHLFYVGGDLMMKRGMLPIIMLPDGACVLCCT